MKQANWRNLLAIGVWAHLGTPAVAMADVSASGYLSISSDYVFRGVSQTMSSPALQAQIDVASDSGWYGYVWGSNVEFIDSSEPDDGVDAEINVGVGYEFAFPGDSTLCLEAVGYLYPTAKEGVNYDYEEWLATLTIAEQHNVQFGYTDSVFGTGAPGVFYALGSGFSVTESSALAVEVGYYQLGGDLDTNYSYAELSIEGEHDSIGWWISYIATRGADEALFYSSTTDDRFVLGLSLAF